MDAQVRKLPELDRVEMMAETALLSIVERRASSENARCLVTYPQRIQVSRALREHEVLFDRLVGKKLHQDRELRIAAAPSRHRAHARRAVEKAEPAFGPAH